MLNFLLLFLAFFLPSPVIAGQLEDGIAAYQQGDYEKAHKLLKPLSESGDPFAEEQLAEMGVVTDADFASALFKIAFKKLLPLAEKGDAKAQLILSRLYMNGWGIKQNDLAAETWLRKAAESGNSDAEYELGWAYEQGRGVQNDVAEAAKWYTKAAEQGDYSAMAKLGEFYESGIGVTQDPSEAKKWIQKAYDQACAFAEAHGLKPIPWKNSDVVGLGMALENPESDFIQELFFYDKGEMMLSVGTKSGGVTDPPGINWRIIPSGKLQIYQQYSDRPYYDLTLISRDATSITALENCKSFERYKILGTHK